MALSAKAGAFNIGTGAATTTVAVTGVGFTPKVVLLFWSGTTTSGNLTVSNTLDIHSGFGVAISSSERRANVNSVDDASNPVASACSTNDDCCIVMMSGGTTTTAGKADVQSMDADGFTLVIDEQFGLDLRIHYLALAHASMLVKLGTFAVAGATGAQTVSSIGLGGTPTGLILFGFRTNTAVTSLNGPIGVTDGTNAWAFDQEQTNGTGAGGSQACHYLRSGEVVGIMSAGSPSVINNRATFTSFGSDQFTINWTERNNTENMHYLAIGGIDVACGASDSLVDNFTISGLSFAPSAVLLLTGAVGLSSADVVSIHATRSIGVATSTTNRFAHMTHGQHNTSPASNFVCSREDAILIRNTPGSTTITDQVDVQSFDSGGVTFVRDVDSDSNFAHAWIAFGAGAAGGSTARSFCGGFIG